MTIINIMSVNKLGWVSNEKKRDKWFECKDEMSATIKNNKEAGMSWQGDEGCKG